MHRSSRSAPAREPASTSCERRSPPSRRSAVASRRRRDCMSTVSSRCAGSAPSPPERSGRARSVKATSCVPSPEGGRCACGACRCTTALPSARKPVSESPSLCRASNEASCGAAMRSSHRPRTHRATGSTSSSKSWPRSPAASRYTTARPACSPGSSASEIASHSCGSRSPSSRRAATAWCCVPERPSAAAA